MDFIFDPSLVLYLPLWKRDGASIISDDAYGQLATVTGALWTPSGRSFDGIDDRIDGGNGASINLTGDGTLEVCVKPTTASAYDGLISKSNGGAVKDYNYGLTTGAGTNAWAGIGDGTTANQIETIAGTVPLNEWTHIVVLWNGTILAIYINGQFSKSAAQTITSHITVANVLELGRDAQNNAACFPGIIGEVRIYSRALSPLEVLHNYLATKWRYR